jgi:hypothetical protein
MIVRGCFYRARGGFLQYSDSSLLIWSRPVKLLSRELQYGSMQKKRKNQVVFEKRGSPKGCLSKWDMTHVQLDSIIWWDCQRFWALKKSNWYYKEKR